jgi:hypothetical protein
LAVGPGSGRDGEKGFVRGRNSRFFKQFTVFSAGDNANYGGPGAGSILAGIDDNQSR